MIRGPEILLDDMLESISRIERYTLGMTESDDEADEKTQDAVVHRLMVIGEAVKGLSADFRTRYPEVPWRDIAGTRDILAHEYFGIDLQMAWDMVRGGSSGTLGTAPGDRDGSGLVIGHF